MRIRQALRAVLMVMTLTSFESVAKAGTGGGIPVDIIVVRQGVVLFNTPATVSQPACSTTGRWAFPLNTPAGQAMLAAIMTASSLQRPVSIYGLGDCSVWGDTETVQHIHTPN